MRITKTDAANERIELKYVESPNDFNIAVRRIVDGMLPQMIKNAIEGLPQYLK